MKHTMIRAILILLCAITSISCQKNDRISETEMAMSTVQPLTIVQTNSPENPENPFDSIGIWHNEILRYIHNSNNSPMRLNKTEITDLISNFASENWGYDNMKIDIPIMDWQESEGITRLQNEIVDNSNLSENGKQQLRLLLSIVSKEAARDKNFSYQNLKESINMLEQRWLYNNHLPVKDTNILQMAASIGRHSAYYWSDGGTKLPIDITPGQEGTPGSSERIIFKNVVRFIATVQWDMTGFVKGYIGGSLKHAASEAAGSSGWVHDFFDYGVLDGW